MTLARPTFPSSRELAVDLYFMEHRAKLLDVAAFLDRLDRAQPANTSGGDDFRVTALRRAIGLLTDGQGERTRRILELLSDPTQAPIPSAGIKGASGAYPGK